MPVLPKHKKTTDPLIALNFPRLSLYRHFHYPQLKVQKMPMQWNEQADARLFANVLKLHVVKIDYAALAKSMGENVTPKAISHRISKIKEKATARRHADWEQHYNQSNKNSNDGVTSTGKKRGPKPKTYRSPRDDEDNRRKRVKAEHVAVVKAEPGIEEEEGAAIEKSREEHVAWSGMGWGPEQQELAQVPGAGERLSGSRGGGC